MLIEYKKKSVAAFMVWLGFWVLFFGALYAGSMIGLTEDVRDTVAVIGYAGSMVVFFFMLYYLSKGKGYPGWYAAVGLAFVLGLLLILLLKDKYPEGHSQAA